MTAKIEIAAYNHTFAAIRAIAGLEATKFLQKLQAKAVFHRGTVGVRTTHLLEWDRMNGFQAYAARHGIEVVRPA